MRRYTVEEKWKIIIKYGKITPNISIFVSSYNISRQTLINWCDRYDKFGIEGLTNSKTSRDEMVKQLQNENKKLKKHWTKT